MVNEEQKKDIQKFLNEWKIGYLFFFFNRNSTLS